MSTIMGQQEGMGGGGGSNQMMGGGMMGQMGYGGGGGGMMPGMNMGMGVDMYGNPIQQHHMQQQQQHQLQQQQHQQQQQYQQQQLQLQQLQQQQMMNGGGEMNYGASNDGGTPSSFAQVEETFNTEGSAAPEGSEAPIVRPSSSSLDLTDANGRALQEATSEMAVNGVASVGRGGGVVGRGGWRGTTAPLSTRGGRGGARGGMPVSAPTGRAFSHFTFYLLSPGHVAVS
jgi:hypothetical protein